MDRAQMLQALQSLGYDVSLITDAVPDEMIAETLRVLQEAAAEKAPAPEPAPPEQMSDGNPAPVPAPAVQPPAQLPPSPPAPSKVTYQFSEADVEKLVAKKIGEREAQIKRHERISVFCERGQREGFLLPAHFDKTSGKPTLQDALEAVAESEGAAVTKFSEGSKNLSPLELIMRVLESGPNLAKFAELVKDPIHSKAKLNPDRRAELLSQTALGKQILAKERK